MTEITIAEAVRRYGRSSSLYRSLAADGMVKARKLSRDWLLQVDSLEAWLAVPRKRGPKPKRRS
jgi:hypothetical protein